MSRRGSIALLSCVLAAAGALAQEPEQDRRDVGRGDVHSPGWKAVEQLKGEPVSPRFPALGSEIRREVLDNGLVIYLREDRSLPLVRAELIVKVGTYHEGAGQIGLAATTAEQMRAGGTARMSAIELDDRLAYLAAELRASASDETSRVSLDILSSHADEGLALFADVVLRPAFDPERIELAKRNQLFRLRHRNDSPQQILQRELDKLLYTAEHPKGRELRPEHVTALERDALVAFHQGFWWPDRAFLAVVGDFSHAAMLARLRELFGGWAASGAPPPPLPTLRPVPRPGIWVVDRDLNQSSISVAHWGVNRENPDRFAISLMNVVLGGGSFSSRITERVRSDEGLAYSAGSRYPVNGREVEPFQATVQTKTESTVRAVQLIREEIEKMQGGEISQNEYATARESRLYAYVFNFDDPVDNVVRLMDLEIQGLPADFYQREFRGYQSASREDMTRGAKRYLKPGEVTIFVVGKLDAFRDELAKLGEIHTVALEEFDLPGPAGRQGGPPGGRRRSEAPPSGGTPRGDGR